MVTEELLPELQAMIQTKIGYKLDVSVVQGEQHYSTMKTLWQELQALRAR